VTVGGISGTSNSIQVTSTFVRSPPPELSAVMRTRKSE